jgi:hypothetical protein
MLLDGRVAGWITDVDFSFQSNTSSSIIALGLTRPVIEKSISNLPWGKGWSTLKVRNLTINYEPNV